MDLNKIPLFGVMTERLNWLSQRQTVLAQNIANANTPGYQPKDLKEPDFKAMLARSGGGNLDMARTQGNHLGGGSRAVKHAPVESGSHETTPTGNGVVLEEQLMKTAETRMDYTATLNLYRKHVDMIKVALGSNR